jgi:hypothetical protein
MKTYQAFNGSQTPVNRTSKESKSKSKKGKRLGVFGFDEEEQSEGEAEKFKCAYPPCWQHLIDNTTCDLCEDDAVKLAVLSYSLVTAKFDVYLHQNLKLDTLDKIHAVCQRFMDPKSRKVTEDQTGPSVCEFRDDTNLKDIYVECLSLMAETSLQLGKTDTCGNVVQTAQEFFQTQCVNDLVSNLIQNKFTIFKAQMCLMRSTASKADSGDQGDEMVDISPLEKSIQPEEMASVILDKSEEVDPLTVTEVDCQELVKDIEKLDINDLVDVNLTQTGIKKNKGRRGTRKKQEEKETSETLPGTSCVVVKEEAGMVESKATKKSVAGTRRKTSNKSVLSGTTQSVLTNTTKSMLQGTRQGNTRGSLTEEPTNTPASSVPDFVLRTPFSVCSRKALMFSSDSSDEDTVCTLPVGKIGTGSSVAASNPDSCSSTNSTPNTTKGNAKSKIPKYVKRSRVSKTQSDPSTDIKIGKQVNVQNSSVQDLPVSRVKKSVKHNSVCQDNKENVPTKKTVSRGRKGISSEEPAKTSDVEPVKTTSRGRKKAVEKVVTNDCSVKKESKKMNGTKDGDTCIYDFDDDEINKPSETKTTRKTTKRMTTKGKRQPAEKARSAEADGGDGGQADLIRQIGYYSVEEETSLSSEEENQPRIQEVQISKPEFTDCHQLEENYSALQEGMVKKNYLKDLFIS